MKFNLTTEEGIALALETLGKWGWDVPTKLKWPFSLTNWWDRAKMIAPELMKAGMLNDVGKMEIILPQYAKPDFDAGIEGIPIRRVIHNSGAGTYEIGGRPIKTYWHDHGTITIEVVLKNVAIENSTEAIFCIRCNAESLTLLLNREYKCNACKHVFSATQFKDYLLERLKETEQSLEPGVCSRCGRSLADPNWCSWCGSEPGSKAGPITTFHTLREKLAVIEKIMSSKPGET
jgi:hypothetical protein